MSMDQNEVIKHLFQSYRTYHNSPIYINMIGKSRQGMSMSSLNLIEYWEQYVKYQNCSVSTVGL